MTWNYRIIRKRIESIYNNKISVSYDYFIGEAYYDKNGKVGMISHEGSPLYGDTVGQLSRSFLKMKKAFYLPILDFHKIPEPGYQETPGSMSAAMKNGKLMEKIEDDELDSYPSDEEIAEMDREMENERIAQDKLYGHLIREFVYEEPKGMSKLEDFYKKD